MSSGVSTSKEQSSRYKLHPHRLYGYPFCLASTQTRHWHSGFGVQTQPPEPVTTNFTSFPLLFQRQISNPVIRPMNMFSVVYQQSVKKSNMRRYAYLRNAKKIKVGINTNDEPNKMKKSTLSACADKNIRIFQKIIGNTYNTCYNKTEIKEMIKLLQENWCEHIIRSNGSQQFFRSSWTGKTTKVFIVQKIWRRELKKDFKTAEFK